MPQPRALRFQPALKRARVGEEKTLQQIAAVEREGFIRPAAVDRVLEPGRVAPDDVVAQADLIGATRHDRLLAQSVAQHVQGLVQGRAGVRVVQIRPK